jgi:membrane associated rhomboid family serine protease
MHQRPSRERPSTAAPIVAGSIIVGSMVLCAGIGFGLGSLAGVAVLTGLAGLFVGLVLGFVIVYDRYRDL